MSARFFLLDFLVRVNHDFWLKFSVSCFYLYETVKSRNFVFGDGAINMECH